LERYYFVSIIWNWIFLGIEDPTRCPHIAGPMPKLIPRILQF
jgi:hypothetical protein